VKVTPSIIRHEFIGLEAKIVKSSNNAYIGLSGKVLDETRNTFLILGKDGKKRRIIKDVAVFHFKWPDGTIVEIDGKLLVGRPEDRLKKRIKRLW